MTFNKEFLIEMRKKKETYKEMIKFCCDSLIMNNYIIPELTKKEIYFEKFCGDDCYYVDNNGEEITKTQAEQLDYTEYEEIYFDIYQYFIIDEAGAERLKTFTNELVYYSEDLDIYILCVCHYGTSWSSVPANWKTPEEMED